MTSTEPMFKIVPWRVSNFKNYSERLRKLVEILSELDEYTIEVSYETDKNHNEILVLWLNYELSSQDELIYPMKVLE